MISLNDVRLPVHLRMTTSDCLCDELVGLLRGIDVSKVAVAGSVTGFREWNTANLHDFISSFFHITDASVESANSLAIWATVRKVEVLIAIGGGKAIDVVKYACNQAGLTMIGIPTLVSNDGIASPVAVLSDGSRFTQSLKGMMPYAVLVPLDIIRKGPSWSPYAALGDVLGNYTALGDWRYSQEVTGEDFNDYAALLSEVAWRAAYRLLNDERKLSQEWWRELVHTTMLSSLSMCVAGSSRPASGSEHLISHAMERVLTTRRPHGLQVGFGTVVCLCAYEDTFVHAVTSAFKKAGIVLSPLHLGISSSELSHLIGIAPTTRPGRITRLSDIPLKSPAEIYADVCDAWGEEEPMCSGRKAKSSAPSGGVVTDELRHQHGKGN